MIRTEPKARTCSHCGRQFKPALPMQSVCGYVCAGRQQQAKRKAEKAEDKQRKEALKSRNEIKGEAQDAFNAWVRARDAELPCVSCGVVNPPMLPGGQWDAGHFLSRGAYPELAFDEDNCHKQCKSCNAGSGKFAHKARTVGEKYEEELARRIGAERLAALKGPHPARKWTREELVNLRATYKNKLKELKNV